MKVNITFCFVERKKSRRGICNYKLMTQYCIASLLKTGFPSSFVTCIAENEEHCERLANQFNIRTILGPPLPRYLRHKKLSLYRIMCLSEKLSEPIDNNTIMAHCDVDALFTRNPTEYLSGLKTDVWTQGSYRYLRPSRKIRLRPEYINPKTDKFGQLSGYFGSQASAYLFMKYKMDHIYEFRLHGGFLAINPNVYESLIRMWRQMTNDLLSTKYIKGEQDSLSAAVHYLGLSCYRTDGNFDSVKQYPGGADPRYRMIQDAKQKLGIRLPKF